MITVDDFRNMSQKQFAEIALQIVELDGYQGEVRLDSKTPFVVEAVTDSDRIGVGIERPDQLHSVSVEELESYASYGEQYDKILIITPERFSDKSATFARDNGLALMNGAALLAAHDKTDTQTKSSLIDTDSSWQLAGLYVLAVFAPPIAYWVIDRKKISIACLATFAWLGTGVILTPIHIRWIRNNQSEGDNVSVDESKTKTR